MKYKVLAIYQWNIIELDYIDWIYYKLDKNNKTKIIDPKSIRIITIF